LGTSRRVDQIANRASASLPFAYCSPHCSPGCDPHRFPRLSLGRCERARVKGRQRAEGGNDDVGVPSSPISYFTAQTSAHRRCRSPRPSLSVDAADDGTGLLGSQGKRVRLQQWLQRRELHSLSDWRKSAPHGAQKSKYSRNHCHILCTSIDTVKATFGKVMPAAEADNLYFFPTTASYAWLARSGNRGERQELAQSQRTFATHQSPD